MLRYFLVLIVTIVTINTTYSQDTDELFVRLVKIEIDPASLTEYKAILSDQIHIQP
jgi:hypothetical protein